MQNFSSARDTDLTFVDNKRSQRPLIWQRVQTKRQENTRRLMTTCSLPRHPSLDEHHVSALPYNMRCYAVKRLAVMLTAVAGIAMKRFALR